VEVLGFCGFAIVRFTFLYVNYFVYLFFFPAHARVLWLQERMVRLGVVPNVRSYNALLAAAQAVGDLDAALSLLDEMQVAGLSPDAVTYCTLISTCQRHAGGDWQAAMALFKDMRGAGIAPNLQTLNALLSTCGTAKKWQQALQVGPQKCIKL
jgi:pentatricopeptide repeat protein